MPQGGVEPAGGAVAGVVAPGLVTVHAGGIGRALACLNAARMRARPGKALPKRPQLRKQKWLLRNSTKIAAQFLGLEQCSQKASGKR